MVKKFWRDFWERVGSTAVQAGLAVLLTFLETGGDIGKDWRTVGLMALNAAVLAAIKALAAKKIGNGDSASLDPKV